MHVYAHVHVTIGEGGVDLHFLLQTRHDLVSGTIELSMNVLTMGYWPPYTPVEVILPSQVCIVQYTRSFFHSR